MRVRVWVRVRGGDSDGGMATFMVMVREWVRVKTVRRKTLPCSETHSPLGLLLTQVSRATKRMEKLWLPQDIR